MVIFLHGGGLFSSATSYVPWLCPRFCRQCAMSGKVCVEVDYPLSRLPLELAALAPCILSAAAVLSVATLGQLASGGLVVSAWLVFAAMRWGRQRIQHPLHLKACAMAVAWAQAHVGDYGGDPGKIVLWGHSAGGQLSALLAFASEALVPSVRFGPIAGLVLLSAPLDYRVGALSRLHPLARAVVRALLLREPFGGPQAMETASPLAWLDSSLDGAVGGTASNAIPPLPAVVAEAHWEFVVPWVNRQAAPILCPALGAAALQRRGCLTFIERIEGADHFGALTQCRHLLVDSHPFWEKVAARALVLNSNHMKDLFSVALSIEVV